MHPYLKKQLYDKVEKEMKQKEDEQRKKLLEKDYFQKGFKRAKTSRMQIRAHRKSQITKEGKSKEQIRREEIKSVVKAIDNKLKTVKEILTEWETFRKKAKTSTDLLELYCDISMTFALGVNDDNLI